MDTYPHQRPTLSLANDVELVVRGLEAMLAAEERVELVQVFVGTTPLDPADVLLIDTFGAAEGQLDRMKSAVENPDVGTVVLYSFHVTEALVDWARTMGLGGVVSKSVHGRELADLVIRASNGEFVVDLGSSRSAVDDSAPLVKDLSFREAEVLALMAAGRTNAEIARTLYLSVETVKTYVSRVFTKLDVRNRTEAALWATRVGLGKLEGVAPSGWSWGGADSSVLSGGHPPSVG